MTLRSLCFLLFFGFLHSASGQNFGGGAYAGLTSSQINGDGFSGFNQWGVQAGVFTEWSVTDNAELLLELAFIQKGSRVVPDTSNNFTQYRARVNYLAVPVLYRFHWNDLSFEVGPALDIYLNSSEETQYVEFDGPEFNRFSLTGIAGVNYHFSERWHASFRTNLSITPARRGGGRGTPAQISIGGFGQRHVVLSTSLVYSLGGY